MTAVAALLLSIALGGPHPALQPLPTMLPPDAAILEAPEPPVVDAVTMAVHHVDSDTELVSIGGDLRRAMASVTKVMTALLVAENANAATGVTISATAAATPIGYVGQPEVLEGETWRVGDLLNNLLIQSGNDAAVALAEHVAGTEAAFVDLMNGRAAELGLTNTAFQNPNGLDRAGHYSSARDLITLGMAAIEEDLVLRTARLKYVTLVPAGRGIPVRNTNRLLGTFPGVFGIKTGDTLDAGQVLLALYDTGTHRYLSVVMGSRGHIDATAELLQWVRGSLGVRDHLLAGLLGTPELDTLPPHIQASISATRPLPTGLETAGAETPAERAIVDQLGDLLPVVLGGSA